MLQQTRVDQAAPYYHRFIDRFPDVGSLASAPIDDVLRVWEGLGYYSRARNLHRAARMVMEEQAGYLPTTYEGLRTLPGIGPYTAAAVASIAYGETRAAVDGNVVRVLSRVFAVEHDAKSTRMRRAVQALADDVIPRANPGRYNEAVMELGATVCTPVGPDCATCPLSAVCDAARTGRQADFPRSAPRLKIPHHDIAVGLIIRDGSILIQQRAPDAMLGGLWEFPGGKRQENEQPEETCRREVREETGLEVEVSTLLTSLRHAYSHFRITLHAYLCSVVGGSLRPESGQPQKWVPLDHLDQYAFPRANRRVLAALLEHERW